MGPEIAPATSPAPALPRVCFVPASHSDIAETGWAPVTVRVAWTLRALGVAVRPEVLEAAREHVWYHLPTTAPLDVAEDRAEHLVRQWVARARRQTPKDPWPEDADLVPRAGWRDRLYRGLSVPGAWVLRHHYADGESLVALERASGIDRLTLDAAREGLREVLRRVAARDGVPVDGWPDARLDRLLHRLAVMAAGHGPPLLDCVDGLHPDHLKRCVRSARAWRLVREGVLTRQDLLPPGRSARPSRDVRVLALHFHPEGRHHRAALARELPGVAFPVGDDVLVAEADDREGVWRILALAAEVGRPSRDHLRGVRLRSPGRWCSHGLVGPTVERVDEHLRGVSWGTVKGMGELPDVLPEPPSALWPWAGVLAFAAVTVFVLSAAFAPEPSPVDHPLTVAPAPLDGAAWLTLDVDDEAFLAVVVRTPEGHLEIVADGRDAVDKARFAVGDGSFRLRVPGDDVLVVSTARPIVDLDDRLLRWAEVDDPLAHLAASLRRSHPGADVFRWDAGDGVVAGPEPGPPSVPQDVDGGEGAVSPVGETAPDAAAR